MRALMVDAPLKDGVEARGAQVAHGVQVVRRADASLAELYRRHLAELTRYIARAFGSGPPDPEDVAQAAFAQFAALDDWQSVENPRAFLYRSARNLALDHKRRDAVRARFARDQTAATEHEIADDRNAERVLSAKQRLLIVEKAILAMEPRRRTVFVLSRVHELSSAEISRRLRMPETTVKRLVAAAIVDCERSLRAHGLSDGEAWR